MTSMGPEPDALRGQGESLHTAITQWACHAEASLLALLGILGGAGCLLVLVVDWRRWPIAALLLSAATIGGWGLVEQKATRPCSMAVKMTEWLLAGMGGLAAALGALGLLFWLLGPAPIL